MSNFCKQPDRDVPRMKCGYPLTCPYHTAVVDTTVSPTTITLPVTADVNDVARERIKQIANALSEDDDK